VLGPKGDCRGRAGGKDIRPGMDPSSPLYLVMHEADSWVVCQSSGLRKKANLWQG